MVGDVGGRIIVSGVRLKQRDRLGWRFAALFQKVLDARRKAKPHGKTKVEEC